MMNYLSTSIGCPPTGGEVICDQWLVVGTDHCLLTTDHSLMFDLILNYR